MNKQQRVIRLMPYKGICDCNHQCCKATNSSAILVIGFALSLLLPANAFAQTPMAAVLCSVLAIIYGDFGRAVSTLAVISLGVGALFGKISWTTALTVAVGIGVLFGSSTFVSLVLASITGIGTVC